MSRQLAIGGETNEWYTPPEIFHALDVEFDLDPCHPVDELDWIPARRHFNYLHDGLSQHWDGNVWLNPPYGPDTAKWLGRLAAHGNGIALVFARTDVRWFHTIAPQADQICFLSGRVKFISPEPRKGKGHNAAAPSCLMAFGFDNAQALSASGLGLRGKLR